MPHEDEERMEGISDLLGPIKLAGDLLPLLSYGQKFLAEKDLGKRIEIAGDVAEWAASKTATKLDDKIVKLTVDMLSTDKGEAWVAGLISLGAAAAAQEAGR